MKRAKSMASSFISAIWMMAGWSAAYQPTCVDPRELYQFQSDSDSVEFSRRDNGIECQLTVSVGHRDTISKFAIVASDEYFGVGRGGSNSRVIWNGCCARKTADATIRRFQNCLSKRSCCASMQAILARAVGHGNSDESEFWGFHSVARRRHWLFRRVDSIRNEPIACFIGRGRTLAAPALRWNRTTPLGRDRARSSIRSQACDYPLELEPGESQELFVRAGRRGSSSEIDKSLFDCAGRC